MKFIYTLIALFLFAGVAYSSRPADTDTPFFSLSYSDVSSDGVVHLRWSSSDFPDITQTVFVLQRCFSAGTWLDIATVYGNKDSYNIYDDSLYACGDSVNYRAFAGVPDVSDTLWLGISDIKKLFVKDITPPEYVSLDSVSVGLNEHLYFGWNNSVSADADGYIVMRQSGGSMSEFARVSDVGQTYCIDTLLSREQALALEFKLQVFDKCDNRSINSDGLFVAASEVVYNGCDDKVTVKYSAAGNPLEKPDRLILYGLRQNGESEMVTDAPYALDHIFTVLPADASEFVAFKITVRSSATGISASTYIDSFAVLPPPVPKEFHIASVSVNEDGAVSVKPVVDTSVLFGRVELYRSSEGADYERVISWKNPLPDTWNDNSINAADASYSYYGVISDTCGRAAHQSEVHTTMFLTSAIAGENIFRFSWSPYEGWHSGVETYRIYKIDVQSGTPVPIDSVYNTTTYDMTVPSLEDAFGARYFIEAVAAKTQTGIADIQQELSRSNIVTLETTNLPEIFMPTGFAPDGGITTVYKPIGKIQDLSEYSFRIYDRTGKMIFQSKDPTVGWDGTVDGKNASASIYTYYITIKKGENFSEYTGSFVLIR
ncbi:MAG: gliding motility-associated C-terminal domain-containing protein [Bacteroidales bacterium]|jgi:gliding motility-associated-like protein|nr:gliding motility-associated C-terminal domain-containing protein [Bacteroidales bacterium]